MSQADTPGGSGGESCPECGALFPPPIHDLADRLEVDGCPACVDDSAEVGP